MSFHCVEEAEIISCLLMVFIKIINGSFQRLNYPCVCFGHSLQDLFHHRKLKLLAQSTEEGGTLLPKVYLRQRSRGLEQNTNNKRNFI